MQRTDKVASISPEQTDTTQHTPSGQIPPSAQVTLKPTSTFGNNPNRQGYCFSPVMDALQDGFIVLDNRFRVREVNPAFCRMTGYSVDEVIGAYISEFGTTDPQEIIDARIKQIIGNGSAIFETLYRHKDGSIIELEVSATYVSETIGNWSLICFCRNISGRKRSEAESAARLAISEIFHQSAELSETYQKLAECLVSTLGFPMAFIGLYDAKNQEMINVGTSGIPNTPLGTRHPAEDVFSGRVAMSGKEFCESFASKRKEPHFEPLKQRGIETLICVPVRIGNEVIGTITVADQRPRHNAESWISNLATIATALALEIKRKQGEKALSEESIRRRILFEQAKDGIVIIGNDLEVIDANKAFADMLGYTIEETHQLHVWDWEANYPTKEQVLALWPDYPAYSCTFETKHKRKDGSLYDVEISWNPAEYNGHKHLYCVCRDISERKKGEEAKRQSEALLNQVLESTLDAVFAIDPDYRLLINNQTHQQVLSDSGGHLLLRGENVLSSYYPQEVLDYWHTLYDRALLGEEIRFETEWTDIHGHPRVYENSLSPLRDKSGSIIGALDVAHDITDSKQAEVALHDSEAKLRIFIEHAPVALAMFDRDMRYLGVSRRWLSDYNLGERDIIGYSHYEIFPNLLEGWKDAHRRGMSGETVRYEDDRYVQEDGSVMFVRWEVWPWYTASKEIGGIILFTENVTERKLAEENLRKSEQQFRALVEGSPYATFVQTDLCITYANAATSKLFGVASPEELLGKPIIDRVHPQFRDTVKERIRLLNEKRQPTETIEQVMLRMDGSEVSVEASAIPIVYEGKEGALVFLRDVTEQKKAFTALRESELLFSKIFYSSPIGIHIIRLSDHRSYIINESFLEIIGYSHDEVAGRAATELNLVDPETRNNWLKTLSEGKAVLNQDILIRQKSGEFRNVLTSLDLIEINGERMVFVIATDITERKRAEAKLVESEERLRSLVETTSDWIWEVDNSGHYTQVSPKIKEILGYTPQEVLGRPPFDFMPEEEAKRIGEVFSKIVASQKPFAQLENINLHRDGRKIVLETSGVPVFDYNGKFAGYRGMDRDITERKMTEEARRQWADAFETCSHGIAMGNPVTNRFLACNPAFAKMLMRTVAETVGSPIIDVYVPSDHQQVAQFIHEADRLGIFQYKAGMVRKDGSVFPVQVDLVSVRDTAGNILYRVATVQDITEAKQADEDKERLQGQLAQAQKMESVGRLAGGVAHDFNNFLMAIVGYTELCRIEIPPSHSIHKWLNEIESSVERSASLTRQLLTFARKQTIIPKVLDLNDTVTSMLKLLGRLIGEDIELVWIPDPNLWPVRLDPTQVDQILANLCVNSRDAISGVGNVTIETKNVTVDDVYCAIHTGSVPGEYVMLTVSDDGIGMDKNVLEHIFDPFFTTKEMGKGTGLGLATVYGIVKQNNGYINVYSEPGKGTTFKVYLPRFVGEVEKTSDAKQKMPPKGHGETIILVEDDNSLRTTFSLLLKTLDYTVLVAESPMEALNLFEQHSNCIDLLLTDVVMPEMNGRELAEKLCAKKPDLKVLYMSGYTADMIGRHGILHEGIHFIAKPFSLEELARKVRTVLESK